MRTHLSRFVWSSSVIAGLSLGCGGDDGAAAPNSGSAGGSAGAKASNGGTAGAGATAGKGGAGIGGTGATAGGAGASAGIGGASAGAAGATQGLPTELPLTVAVDAGVKASTSTWPGLDGITPRAVAAISAPGGKTFGFVANELILTYTSAAERDAFVAKWSGKVLLEVDPSAKGVTGLPAMALIQVNPSAANVDEFIPAARKMAPTVSGDHRVSSEEGLKLLTAALTENVAGRQVSLNWIGFPTGFTDRDVKESPTSSSIGGYTPNPFSWNHLRAGSVQDIGVTEAWRALELEGKLGNRVKIAILDGGFVPDADFPASYDAASVVAWKTPTKSTSPNYCGGAKACDYHGTSVLHVATAVVDNGFGVAGTGGPVAEAISVVTLFDMFTSISALLEARARGADIINMSFGIGIPSILAGTIIPMNNVTTALSSQGVALIAAAGNDGDNVDSEECFTLCVPFSDKYCWKDCFETYWHFPCENDGVECIGGIELNKRNRAPNSNYGTRDVRLFAPYTVRFGATPDNADPVQSGSGTSFSAPYVAGVAALVKAANPALSGDEILSLLRATAHSSSDPVVPGYVNAQAAVASALGGVRPTVRILAPIDGSVQGATGPGGFKLIATSEDYEDGIDSVKIAWESDLDGPLGPGHTRDALFTTPGTRTITATATDSDGKVGKSSVKLTIENAPPSLALISPENSDGVTAGVPFVAAVSSWDPESFGSLPCGNVAWTLKDFVSKQVTALGTGCALTTTIPDAKLYELVATGKDAQGAESSTGLVLAVKALPASGPPFVSIIQPLPNTSLSPQTTVKLVGSAIDPDDPSGGFPLVYTWTGKLTGGSAFPLGTGPIVDWKPANDIGSVCGDKAVELSLTVKDGGGQITTKKVTVSVLYPPC